MEAKTNLKSSLSSRHVTEGPERAPHRSYHYVMGGTDEQTYQPFIAVASCWNEAAACDIALMRQAQAVKKDIAAAGGTPREFCTITVTDGSTNAALHLPAIAHECAIAFDLFDAAEVFKRTPYIADLKPGGRFVAKDLFEAGGVPLVMKTLLDNGFLHGECMTVTGGSMAENLPRVAWNSDQDVVRPAEGPLTATGGVVGLRGNLAPDGAVVKVAGMQNLEFTGPARCFDGEEACAGSLDVQLSDAELEKRRAAWQPRGSAFGSGYLWKYAQQVGSARHGAVTHPGGSTEKTCYADI